MGCTLLLLALAAVAISAPAAAQNEVQIDVLVEPILPQEGSTVSINMTLRNLTPANITQAELIIFHGNSEFQRYPALTIPANGTSVLNIATIARIPSVLDNTRGLIFVVQRPGPIKLGEKLVPEYRVIPKPAPPSTFPVVQVGAGAGVGGVAIALLLLYRRRRAEEERIAAELAARAAVEERVAAEAAREAAATKKVGGKFPPEYYVRHRVRLAVLVPSGLTSGGETVLARREKEVKKVVYTCPRCGTQKDAFDAPCPRCSVQDGVDLLREEIRKHRAGGADFSDVTNLLQQAEFQLSYSSFGEAQAFIDTAKKVFGEILSGGARVTKVKRLETITAADSVTKILDLGEAVKHTEIDLAKEEKEHEVREEYAREGTHCPTCGHAMYGDFCAYCNFDTYAGLVEEAIGAARIAGANVVEPANLLERGLKVREEGNKETASRYLNRARFLAKRSLEEHQATTADGMIDYARTMMLTTEEDGVTADFGEAERLMADAEAARASGRPGEAIELVKKAEVEIQQALHELAKGVAIKRIDSVARDIDDAKSKGVKTDPAEAKLKEAREAFDTGEFEHARDLVEDVRRALAGAAEGKQKCPKCGKPVQPTWARCPFCTTPLK